MYGPEPHVDGLEEFTAHMAGRGVEVRQIWTPGVEVDDEWIEGRWVIHVYRTTRLEDGRYWYHGTTVDPQLVAEGVVPGWDLLADLLESEQVPS